MASTKYFRFSSGPFEAGGSYGICFDSGDVSGSEVCHLKAKDLEAIETGHPFPHLIEPLIGPI